MRVPTNNAILKNAVMRDFAEIGYIQEDDAECRIIACCIENYVWIVGVTNRYKRGDQAPFIMIGRHKDGILIHPNKICNGFTPQNERVIEDDTTVPVSRMYDYNDTGLKLIQFIIVPGSNPYKISPILVADTVEL